MASYTVVSPLGHGGFGVVERVHDAAGNSFARKTFKPSSSISPSEHDGLRKRFKREVTIQRELGGSGIMPILDYDLNAIVPWFVMPLAEKTYEQQVNDDRKSGSVDINAIADILNGLDRLHQHGYVHRDLNPKNVLFHDGQWKLSDLGAVLPPSGNTVTLTEDTVIYTERYCAPEQRHDFHSAKPSADVYSFGCILHDIFGKHPRTPYAKHSADGPVGVIIEKCTEPNPGRRPSIRVLSGMLLDTLVEIGGHCKVSDQKSSEWLLRLDQIDTWIEAEFDEFARFFAQLDIEERTGGHEGDWVYSLSTPFLTRLPATALANIAKRNDGVAAAIVEKYCQWARSTSFLFHFADTVCTRLSAIYDVGDAAAKAMAIVSLLELGHSHNRWYVMRQMLSKCQADQLSRELARRIAIEIQTEELESEFKHCISTVAWNINELAAELAKIANA